MVWSVAERAGYRPLDNTQLARVYDANNLPPTNPEERELFLESIVSLTDLERVSWNAITKDSKMYFLERRFVDECALGKHSELFQKSAGPGAQPYVRPREIRGVLM